MSPFIIIKTREGESLQYPHIDNEWELFGPNTRHWHWEASRLTATLRWEDPLFLHRSRSGQWLDVVNNERISPTCSLTLHPRTFNIIIVLTFSKIRALRAMPLGWQELKSKMWAVGTAPWTHGVRAPGWLSTQQVSQPYHSFSMLLNLEILSHFSKAPLISPEKPRTKNSS